MADDSDPLTLKGVPIYRGGAVPDGFAALIEEIADDRGAPAQEVADSAAETAIANIFDQLRSTGDGVREPYKDMLNAIQADMGRDGVVLVRRSFGNVINDNHSAVIEAREVIDEAVGLLDEDDLDPHLCQFVKADGEQCQNEREHGSDYCHLEKHAPAVEV